MLTPRKQWKKMGKDEKRPKKERKKERKIHLDMIDGVVLVGLNRGDVKIYQLVGLIGRVGFCVFVNCFVII